MPMPRPPRTRLPGSGLLAVVTGGVEDPPGLPGMGLPPPGLPPPGLSPPGLPPPGLPPLGVPPDEVPGGRDGGGLDEPDGVVEVVGFGVGSGPDDVLLSPVVPGGTTRIRGRGLGKDGDRPPALCGAWGESGVG